VVLVNYKRALDTIACAQSVNSTADPFSVVDICIQDNSPKDTNSQFNALLSKYRNVKVFNSKENLGFAAGNNSGFKNCTDQEYSFVWFLNNDTEVPPDCLSEMLKKFDQPGRKVGMVGSTMVYFHDKKTVQALGGSVYKPWTGTMREIGNGLQWPCPVDEAAVEAQMSYVCGASMLVSAELIRDVGLMQEDYFLFFEEIDWCERARKAGYELAYASQAVVFHKEGAAIGTGTGARRSLLAEYYGMRNKLKVTWRFFPWAMPTVWLISWLQVLRRLMQGRPANAWLMARVLLGLGQRPAT
jgi:GT2 family glycosyltransferase